MDLSTPQVTPLAWSIVFITQASSFQTAITSGGNPLGYNSAFDESHRGKAKTPLEFNGDYENGWLSPFEQCNKPTIPLLGSQRKLNELMVLPLRFRVG